ncbi:LysR family transcriptional regulator [Paraburkholderia sp. HP33-1]|uniref:LysR family transcriptional regulator n=1 Tax=Paraburkholderia sp. HP33-1 TaxID=2883243 RepID=UPI001F211370|nr:LysR family transcriptional regulator [Paraburkholderia sp. HP33-1]
MDMDVQLWRLFVQIVEYGSVTRVASARDVAQSVVSRQLATIEKICGGRLFERTGRGVRLNEAGARIYPRVVAWLEEGNQLSRDVRRAANVPAGTVKVGILSSISRDFTSSLYERITKAFPEIHLHIFDGPGRQISEWLEAQAIDFGVVLRNTKEERRSDIRIGPLSTALIGPPGDVLTSSATVEFSKLAKIPLVLAGHPNVSRDLLEHHARRKGIEINVPIECDSIPLQKHLVATSHIYAILGRHAVREELHAGQLQASKIVSPSLTRSIVLSYVEGRTPSAASQAVIDIARAILVPMITEP